MKGRPRKIEAAAAWLKIYLSGGSRPVVDILRAGGSQRFSEGTLKAAKQLLGVQTKKVGNDSNSVWSWYDPTVAEPEKPKDEPLAEVIHALAEIKRLTVPPVVSTRSADSAPIGILGKKSVPVDLNSPEMRARREAAEKREKRYEAQSAVVTSADPFALLKDADAEEIEEMTRLVRDHQSLLADRERGKPKYRKAWQVTEQVEQPTTTREWSTKHKKWIDVPTVQTETRKYISDSPVEISGSITDVKPIDVTDGYEHGEDVTFEMGKWDSWIDRAKQRERELNSCRPLYQTRLVP